MKEENFKVYGYRWVMLAVFMFIVAVNQMLWITFASITNDAVKFYGVSDLSIGLLSMIFMIVYIVISIPASWVIDTYGLRVAVGIGAALTGIFGLMRGLTATS
jgi:fucose permease